MIITHPSLATARNGHEIIQLAESIAFSLKDKLAIDKARVQTEEINRTIDRILADPAHAPSENYFSWLHKEVDRLEQVLIDKPSSVNAELLHYALTRFDEAKSTQNRIGAALGIALGNVSQSISGIAQAHLDKVLSRIKSEADTRRAELAATRHGLFNTNETRALESRVAQLLADLASERTEALQDPLNWIERNGLALDGPEQAEHAA
jgi:hypothetical protein